MQRTLNELIAKLEELREKHGGDTDVYGYGVNDQYSFHGVECIDHKYDDCDENFVIIMHDWD